MNVSFFNIRFPDDSFKVGCDFISGCVSVCRCACFPNVACNPFSNVMTLFVWEAECRPRCVCSVRAGASHACRPGSHPFLCLAWLPCLVSSYSNDGPCHPMYNWGGQPRLGAS